LNDVFMVKLTHRFVQIALILFFAGLLTSCSAGPDGGTPSPTNNQQPGGTTPLTITATTPADHATGVSITFVITATFSETIDSKTVSNTTFTLRNNAAGTLVTGNITTSGATAIFVPTGLLLNTSYTATFTAGIQDLSGNTLATDYSWSFTTAAGPTANTGLEFPRNDQVPDGETVRFKFMDPHLNGLPAYGPGGAGVTYIFKVRPKQQTGYYTTFFWANDDGVGTINSTFLWDNGFANTYYGMHPYPPGGSSGTSHNWEISVDQLDAQGSAVAKDIWYTQVVRVWSDGNGKHHEFYWDWPNTDAGHVVTHTSPTQYDNATPPSPALTFGDAPWQPGQELCSCTLRGIQIYSSLLPLTDIQSEISAPQSTATGNASIWYQNINPTPTDISDKSGAGHHPVWVGTSRPTLYTAP
jgi:hypothetical protein